MASLPSEQAAHPAAAALTTARGDAQFVAQIPIGFAREQGVLGLAHENGALPVAVSRPDAIEAIDAVGRRLGVPVRPVLVSPKQLREAIDRAYGEQTVDLEQVIDGMEPGEVLRQAATAPAEDLLDFGSGSSRAPIIRLVNLILFDAVRQSASDVHIQPGEQKLHVRMRVDGVMFDAFELPATVAEELASRIKVIARMDIAEKRLPQDGRASVRVGDREIDLRIASLPTSYGERVVIRLLDKSARMYRLEELGMDPGTLFRFRELISVEHGLVLVTGPTGSGKSTTLYGSLLEMDTREKNVLTLEDPIEYQLPGVSQTQISTKKGMTFASGLRSVLRQDPDVIMVGEIRDRETATMAIQSALTGHLVFSTLHTNDAASAVTRLLDLGIEPYLVASSVVGVLAQRLVRRVCSHCAAPAPASALELTRLGASGEQVAGARRGSGCAQCRRTGYRGRIGLFELMVIDEQVRQLVSERANASQIEREAIRRGMISLRQDAIAKIDAGVTTVDEAVRVTARASG